MQERIRVQEVMRREAKKLGMLRKEAGLSQQELARELGVSQSYVARVERGTLDPKHSVVSRTLEIIERRKVGRGFVGQFRGFKCSDLMIEKPITVDPRDPASQAMRLMQDNAYSQIPVVRGNTIIGMITEQDVIRELHHDLAQISVQAVMSPEAPPIVDESAPIIHAIPLLHEYQAVLVQSLGRLRGILTRSDLLRLK
ncbi:MAG: CBS domain-containing protein [Candidatus Thorarchaeota archaeon]